MNNPETIQILGSYGELKVHRRTGHIIQRRPFDPAENPYADLLWFDPETLPRRTWADIVETGAIWADGSRDEPCALVSVDGGASGLVEWADLPRLPAPTLQIQ